MILNSAPLQSFDNETLNIIKNYCLLFDEYDLYYFIKDYLDQRYRKEKTVINLSENKKIIKRTKNGHLICKRKILEKLGFVFKENNICLSPNKSVFKIKLYDNNTVVLKPLDKNVRKNIKENMEGHYNIDLLTDIIINSREIMSHYIDSDGDIEKTLEKLQTFNPSWNFIINFKGKDFALNLLKKVLKKEYDKEYMTTDFEFTKYF